MIHILQGSWGGTGARKQAPRPHLIKKVAGVDPKTRADYGKAHVIISEKRDKKAAKYLVKDLPYPYTSKAQFERSMETPLGTEWNTRLGFQKGTLPKIVKKVIIFLCTAGKRGKDTDEGAIRWGPSSIRWRSCSKCTQEEIVFGHIFIRLRDDLPDKSISMMNVAVSLLPEYLRVASVEAGTEKHLREARLRRDVAEHTTDEGFTVVLLQRQTSTPEFEY